MRVLILLNARFPTEKAYGLQVQTVARGLAEAGVDVAVAYPRRTREEPKSIPGVDFLPYGPYLPMVHGLLFLIYRWLGLVGVSSVLESFKPDFVIANDPLQAAYLPKPWRLVWDLHDVPDPNRPSRRTLIVRIMQRATAVVSTTQRKLDRLTSLGFTLPPSIVLPNPVTFDPEVYRSITREDARRLVGMGEEEKAIVYAGQLFDWKGVDTLIEAGKHLPSSYRVHIVGGLGSDLERCRQSAKHIPSVVLHGQHPAEEIPAWLRAADVVVIPNSGKHRLSVEDTNPLKAFEALAAEAAIVASDLPTLRDALGHAAAYFKSDDAQDLAATIMRLCSDAARGPSLRHLASEARLLTAKERAFQLHAFLAKLGPFYVAQADAD